MTAQPPDNSGFERPVGESADAPVGSEAAPVPESPAAFDPYRFGAPAHPIDPAYAPPGYVPPPLTAAPPTPPLPQYPGAFGNYSPPGSPQPGPPGYPSPGYPQQPYGQPAPYGYLPPNPNARNGLAVTALVLGIVGLVFSWVPFFDALIIVPGVIFALIGLSAARRAPASDGRWRSSASACRSSPP